MSQLNWLDEYSVGVQELDFHHKKIFSLISDLRRSVNDKKLSLDEILIELRDYADYHLDTEESYFEKYKYKYAKKHTKAHNMYRKKIDTMINMKYEKPLKVDELVKFLEDWWANHILKEDKKYQEFFNENNLY